MTPIYKSKRHPNPRRRGASRGIALITTLLLMGLMVAMTLGMTIAVTSDTLITRYYRNFRSSFYAADSGTNIVRQFMANQILATIPATFSNTSQPIPAGTEGTVQTSILSTYGSTSTASNLLVTSGSSANTSWPGSFYIASSPAPTLTLTSCHPEFTAPTGGGTVNTPTPAGSLYSCTAGANFPTCTGTVAQCAGFVITDYKYVYNYTLTSMGQSLASEQAQVQDVGAINIKVNVSPAPGTTSSFAGYGMFIDQSPICNGSTLVGGTISGPVFTNGAWNYGTTSVGYNYTDTVGSVSSNFGYQFSSTCDQKSTATDSNSGNTIAPKFNGSPPFKLGQNAVPLPTDSYNQKRAVLDGLGTNDTNPTGAQMNSALRNISTTQYPSSGTPSSGVYLSYSSTTVAGVTTNQMVGGGIYVEGNADTVMLQATTASAANNPVTGVSSGDKIQVVAITQGATTTNVYFDQTISKTFVKSGATVLSIVGVPEDYVNSPTVTPAVMLYVDGNIGTSSTKGLSGPSQGVAAIQNNEEITVTAAGNINITGDLLYSTPPINIPADTVAVPSTTNPEVLGIYTASGNINLYNQQSNSNIEIDASLATIASGGSGGLINPGNAINTLTIVGGRIQNTIQNINATTRNVWFDRRFSQGGFAPPWFPSTTITPLSTDTAAGATTTFVRSSWLAPNQ